MIAHKENNQRAISFTTAICQDVPCSSGLSSEEERRLAFLIASGDREARNRLVQANLGLVVTTARQFLCRGWPLEDLVREGNLGLIRPAEK
jgi:DNA-directed RNA polymerase sigma subunit (sigma70/sigma32)